MQFKKHDVLYPLPARKNLGKFCTFDIEASDWVNVVLCGFYDGKKYRSFSSVKEFLQFFLSKKYRSWKCFAHNLSGYDGQFILDVLTREFPDFSYEVLSNNGPSKIVVSKMFGKRAHKWAFADSLRLLPASLKDLTHSFSVDHKKQEMDYENLTQNFPKLEEYLEFDCRGLYEVIEKFGVWFSPYGAPLKDTTASQAMAVYRRMMPMPLPMLPPDVESFVRKSYYGGRTEVFKMRCQQKMMMYDVRSLYPHVMKKYPMPVGSPRKVHEFHDGDIGFYKCYVTVPDMYIPLLPTAYKGKLMFPCGSIRGYYSSFELELAKKLGCKVHVDYGYVFPREMIFDEYIDTFFGLKQSGDGATKSISKLMLNGLYGKWGQNREKVLTVKRTAADAVGLQPYMPEYGLYQKKTTSTAQFIIPSLSAWITSCARVELFHWLKKAGDEHVYYCDTDSVCTTKRLPTGDGLGDMKLEATADEAIFLLPKMYIMRTGDSLVTKAKGFEREFVKTLSMNSFEKALYGDSRDFSQHLRKFGKFKENLRRTGNFVSMLDKNKSVKTTYSKRTIGPEFNTFPLVLKA